MRLSRRRVIRHHPRDSHPGGGVNGAGKGEDNKKWLRKNGGEGDPDNGERGGNQGTRVMGKGFHVSPVVLLLFSCPVPNPHSCSITLILGAWLSILILFILCDRRSAKGH